MPYLYKEYNRNMLEENMSTPENDDLLFDKQHISFRIMPYEIKTFKVKLK